ncbi:MAG TPA: hypothetical protein VMJ70_07320 [Candidatus Sulfotelmatobacter sp.]|nr:hypothetical protein [Candidatus Sulfotelmatobacter sp.]
MSLRPLPSSRVWAAWSVALFSGAMAMQLAHFAYRDLPRPQPLAELSYYPSGVALRPATLGHAESAADLAWLRAVQYYGGHRLGDNQFAKMEHVFTILTSLSPHFIPAYVFGGFALAQEGRDFPAAERLMLAGLDSNPTSGELAFELGFLYYVKPGERDLRNAARYFEQASRQPDAPAEAARFAAFSRQQSGDLAVAYELWSNVRLHSPNVYLREMAQEKMNEIESAIETGRREAAVHRLSTPRVLIRR